MTDEAYVLGIVGGNIGLYKAEMNQLDNAAFLNNAKKAYMPATTGQNAAFYSFNFDWNGTTGIEEIENAKELTKAIYDLAGRKIEQISAPGIYIINGKKCFVK